MIQDKNALIRRVKELSAMLNKQIGSFPDNQLGLTEADISQQIYTATGLSTEDFLQQDEQALETTINQKGSENRPLLLDFLGNLFFHEYQLTGDKAMLGKAKLMYGQFQKESGTFSMVYFQRMQLA